MLKNKYKKNIAEYGRKRLNVKGRTSNLPVTIKEHFFIITEDIRFTIFV